MATVTKCCNANVVRHHGREYPDGNVFYISTSWDACELCHDEWPETIEEEEEEIHAYAAY
ncbi:hypothetical protein [Paenibacillus qinlingensis]|uniref:Uncharacterized protein n=1 Tax=Paenibacillus qinlingensis TaxID=1837343 RepID=A0ABU1P6U2_9BACL|nr:hypothetical protein [Paenibacillus qinlingensis]MDR6555481.1 hypothetical protein [Paenibacillus qinlingensis]